MQLLAEELNLDKEAVVATDVTKPEQLQALVDREIALYNRIDVIVNNAGIMAQSLLEDGHIDEWNEMIDINLKGVLYGIAAALPYMKKQMSGHIINTSSVAGHKVKPGSAVYSATKTAVRVISEGLRQEMIPYHIRTTVISPGAITSELLDSITDPGIAARMRSFYNDYAIPADSYARAVIFAIKQPENVDINEILFRPTRQEF
ncbi:MAG: SDR family oxidoreductase [Candidatus Arsenophonus phytopathogenicus]